MYAITATSYRAIAKPSDAFSGETVVDTVPASLVDSINAGRAGALDTVNTIRGAADGALDSLRAYRDLASPTNAQTVAVVKLLCRVAIGLIRLQLSKFDGTD